MFPWFSEVFQVFLLHFYLQFPLKLTWVSEYCSVTSFNRFLWFFVVFCCFSGHKTPKDFTAQLLMNAVSQQHYRWKVQCEKQNGEECYAFTWLNSTISSITIGLPRFFIAIPHPPISPVVYDLKALLSTIQGLVSLYFSIGDPRTIIIVRLHQYLVRYHLPTNTY